jgi:hypothetical protein
MNGVNGIQFLCEPLLAQQKYLEGKITDLWEFRRAVM